MTCSTSIASIIRSGILYVDENRMRLGLSADVDTGDAEGLTRFGLSEDDLADPGWRTAMLDGRRVATQEFASALIAAGYAGLLVRSFAKGATASNRNLVLWRWTVDSCTLEVIDDQNRLGRM